MAFYKNVASQRITVFAFDVSTNLPKTGDAANITARLRKDGGATAATNDVNPTEVDATNMPGLYEFDMTQTETNADHVSLLAKSTTANIQLDPVVIFTDPGTNAGLTANTTLIEGSDATTQIASSVDAQLVARKLHMLLANAVAGTDVTDDSVFARLVSKSATADWDTFVQTTDSLEALRDNLATPAQVNTECNAVIVTNRLDHLAFAAVVGTDIVDNSIVAKLVSKSATADWDTFDPLTDSLQAIVDNAATVADMYNPSLGGLAVDGTTGRLLSGPTGAVNLADPPAGINSPAAQNANVYTAFIDVIKGATADRYSFVIHKNGLLVAGGSIAAPGGGAGTPTITVETVNAAGTVLVNQATTTRSGSGTKDTFFYSEATNRIPAETSVMIKLVASIDAADRTIVVAGGP